MDVMKLFSFLHCCCFLVFFAAWCGWFVGGPPPLCQFGVGSRQFLEFSRYWGGLSGWIGILPARIQLPRLKGIMMMIIIIILLPEQGVEET